MELHFGSIKHTFVRFVSVISSPELTLCGTLLYTEFFRWKSLGGTVWIGLYALLSLYAVYFLHKRGQQESQNRKLTADGRNNRILAFTLTLGSFTIPFIQAFYLKDVFMAIYLFMLATVTVFLLVTTIMQNRKMSAHVTFTGMLCVYVAPSWWGLVTALPIMIAVGWSRIVLRRHTLRQVLAAVMTVCILYISFLLITPYVL